MNAYLITCNGKQYATNADNIMEAEDKLAEKLGVEEVGRCEFKVIGSVEELRDDESVIFF